MRSFMVELAEPNVKRLLVPGRLTQTRTSGPAGCRPVHQNSTLLRLKDEWVSGLGRLLRAEQKHRMSPERIQACARIFKVPVGYFYGEGENGSNNKRYDKTVMLVAAEIMELPEDIRKGVYILSRQINKTFSSETNNEKQEQAA